MTVAGIDAECMSSIEQAERDAYSDVLDGKEPQKIHDTVYMQSYRFYRSVSNEHNDRFGDHISDGINIIEDTMNTIRYQLKLLEKKAGLMVTLREKMYNTNGGLTQFGMDFMELCTRYGMPIKTIIDLFGRRSDTIEVVLKSRKRYKH